nr:T9SS type A sorting domain-containing protein [Bacteroidales bacterium]
VSNHLGINTYYDYVFDDYFHLPCFLIDSSSLTITAPTCYNLIDCWWLNGCHIVSPADVDYNPYNYSFEQDGTAITHLNNYLEIQANVTGLPIVSRPEVRIYGVSGGIRVCSDKKPDQNVEVMNMLGQTLYCRPLQCDEDFIPIRSGIYIVRVGKTTEKVIVR